MPKGTRIPGIRGSFCSFPTAICIPQHQRMHPDVAGHLLAQPPSPSHPFSQHVLRCSEGTKSKLQPVHFPQVCLSPCSPSEQLHNSSDNIAFKARCPVPRPRQREKPVPKQLPICLNLAVPSPWSCYKKHKNKTKAFSPKPSSKFKAATANLTKLLLLLSHPRAPPDPAEELGPILHLLIRPCSNNK